MVWLETRLKKYFCAYWDYRYMSRGLALYLSLSVHCSDFELWILCLDDLCHAEMLKLRLPNVRLISLADVEAMDSALLEAKRGRTAAEYYFTCTPALILFVLANCSVIETLTYVDADIFFYGDPACIFEEIGSAPIAIIPHRFPPALKHLERTGIFNVGWLTFRRHNVAFECLNWWRERCLDWCYDRVEEGRYADQKYLDDWPSRFDGVAVVKNPGANLAPWNLANHRLTFDGREIWVDGLRVIFFHFHGYKRLLGPLRDLNLAPYGVKPGPVAVKHVYGPYVGILEEISKQLAISLRDTRPLRLLRSRARGRITARLTVARLLHLIPYLFQRQYVLVFGKRLLYIGDGRFRFGLLP